LPVRALSLSCRRIYNAGDNDGLSLANDSSPGTLSENRGRLSKIDIICDEAEWGGRRRPATFASMRRERRVR
jgi:hypothetical protein